MDGSEMVPPESGLLPLLFELTGMLVAPAAVLALAVKVTLLLLKVTVIESPLETATVVPAGTGIEVIVVLRGIVPAVPTFEPAEEEGVPPVPMKRPDSSFANTPMWPLRPVPKNLMARVTVFSSKMTVPPGGVGAGEAAGLYPQVSRVAAELVSGRTALTVPAMTTSRSVSPISEPFPNRR
jgi:hypothetical protein